MHASASPLQNAEPGAIEPFLERWLGDRRRLISTYCALTVELRKPRRGKLADEALRRFRSQLVDYVCAGHFDVYSRLLSGARPAPERVAQLFPQIDLSTEHALAFDEACNDPSLSGERLLQRLSDLGEEMETRFAREDALIRLIRDRDEDLVAA
jgi:regulator of sigma D